MIEKLTNDVCGASKAIINKPITLSVYSSSVPNLTLIDLPGITRVPIDDQPENIEEITVNMATHYCKDPKTIILCVIPANQDLSTQDSLKLARKLDPHGERTLGVLTKVDLMDEGTDCLKILQNQHIKLRLGYVAVKGRSQLEIKSKVNVEQARKNESNFFNSHPVYASIPSSLWGTGSLTRQLSSVFLQVVQKCLPRVKNEISERKLECKQKLDAFGDDFPEGEEAQLELIFRLVRKFKDRLETELRGKYSHEAGRNSKKKKKPNAENKISFQVGELYENFFEKFSKPDFKVCSDYTDEHIKKAIDYYHGDAIPGFPSFDSFLFLVHPKLEQLRHPIVKMLLEATKIVEKVGLEIAHGIFKKFVILQNEITKIYSDFIKARSSATRRILENLVNCEENYIFTNDQFMYSSENNDREGLQNALETNNILVYELRMKVNRYFNIVVRNLRDSIPKIIGRFLLQKTNNLLEFELLNNLNKVNYCLESLKESPSVRQERKTLRKKLRVLSKAEDLLLNSFGIEGRKLPELRTRQRKEEDSEDEFDGSEGIEEVFEDLYEFNLGLVYGKRRGHRSNQRTARKNSSHKSRRKEENRPSGYRGRASGQGSMNKISERNIEAKNLNDPGRKPETMTITSSSKAGDQNKKSFKSYQDPKESPKTNGIYKKPTQPPKRAPNANLWDLSGNKNQKSNDLVNKTGNAIWNNAQKNPKLITKATDNVFNQIGNRNANNNGRTNPEKFAHYNNKKGNVTKKVEADNLFDMWNQTPVNKKRNNVPSALRGKTTQPTKKPKKNHNLFGN